MEFIKIVSAIIIINFYLVGCSSSLMVASDHISPPTVETNVIEASSDAPEQDEGLISKVTMDKTGDTKIFLDVLQFTKILEIKEIKPSKIPMNGLYTRIKILPKFSQNNCFDGSCKRKAYPYNERSSISRLLVNRKLSINASIIFSAGNYKSTIPLTTIENISTWTEGNSWLRNITYSNIHEPLFLVSNDIASVSSTFRLQSIEESAPQSGAVLGLAVNAIGLISPTSGVLTSINQDEFKNKAAAIDSTLKGVFSKNLQEDVTFSINLTNWSDERKYFATLELPFNGEDWDSSKKGVVGIWEIAVEAPKPSLFYDIHVCPTDKATGLVCKNSISEATSVIFESFRKSPKYSEILGMSLGSKNNDVFTSIQSVVLQLPEVVKIQSVKFETNSDDSNLININAACAAIANKMHIMGLSQFDIILVTWSALNGIPSISIPTSAIIDNKEKLKACKETINKLTDPVTDSV